MKKPGRIIDSDDEDFTQGDQWVTAKEDLVTELQKLIGLLTKQEISGP